MALDLRPGRRFGALEIEEELGRGAYGTVFAARDILIGRRVALKLFPVPEHGAEDLHAALLEEARLIGNLRCPWVVTLFRVHPAEGRGVLLEMEFVPGGTLENRLAKGGNLTLPKTLELLEGICQGLIAAHSVRLVHGDVKPQSILLTADGRPKLSDFGLARRAADRLSGLTEQGRVMGSMHYLAPEAIAGKEIGLSADVWSFAALAYRLVAGRPPFEGRDLGDLVTRIRESEPSPLPPGLPSALGRLIGQGLSRDPKDRSSSLEDVLDLLRDAIEEDASTREIPAFLGRTNCTPPPTSFIGRKADLSAVESLLLSERAGVVTLLGPGGVGKTRLSQEAGRALAALFPGGSWFVDLGEVRDAGGIALAVADVLRVPLGGVADPIAEVAEALSLRDPSLLIADNCEQIREPAAVTLATFRKRAPHMSFLVTSRVALGLPDEHVHPVGPLSTGRDGDAFRLFVDRSREANPDFEATGDSVEEICRIVEELDGIPLAIELAAARARIMRPAEIARNLGRKFQMLRSSRRDVSRRHRTLAAVVDWSYDLLGDWEREAFLQASLFRDGFTVEAAGQIFELSAWPEAPDTLQVLRSLREKSLLTAFDAGRETRLGMYRAIQEYGEARWRNSAPPERQQQLDERHSAYYLELVDRLNSRIPSFYDQEAMDRISREVANVSAVQVRALAGGDVDRAARAVLGLAETMIVRHPAAQLVNLLDEVLGAAAAIPASTTARALLYHGTACRLAGNWQRALDSIRRAAELSRDQGLDAVLARVLVEEGELHRSRGELDAAVAAFDEGRETATRAGSLQVMALGIGGRGMVLGQRRDLDTAHRSFEEAVRLAREAGDHQTLVLHLHNLGVVHESRAELDLAIEKYREAEDLARRHGNLVRVAVSLGGRANALSQQGDLRAALRCYSEAEKIARDLGAKQRVAQITGNRGAVLAMAGRLDDALQCYEEAEKISRELGDRRRVATTLCQKARLHISREEYDVARLILLEAETICLEIDDHRALARIICDRGVLDAQQGRTARAIETLRAGLAKYEELGAGRNIWVFSFRSHLASLLAQENRKDEAREEARIACELADSLGIDTDHGDPDICRSYLLVLGLRG